jgi:hypothetical protein
VCTEDENGDEIDGDEIDGDEIEGDEREGESSVVKELGVGMFDMERIVVRVVDVF